MRLLDDSECPLCSPTDESQAKCEDCGLRGPATELRQRAWDGALVGPCCADRPTDTDFPYIQPFEGDPDGHPREN